MRESSKGSISLDEQQATIGQRRAAALACVSYAVVVAALLPFATARLAPMPAMTAVFAMTVFITDICTFVLLAAQFRAGRASWLLLLASGYLFSALMALLHLLTFSGAVVPGAPILGRPGTVAWLYLFWGLGFIALLFAAVLTDALGKETIPRTTRVYPALVVAVLSVFSIVALLFALATVGLHWLPPPISGDKFAPVDLVLNASRSALALAALAILWFSRRRSVLHVWLALALVAAALGPVLTDLGGQRYTFGWYAGRVSFAFASAVLLVVLLAEFIRLQQALAAAIDELKKRTQLLQAEMERRELTERTLAEAQKMEAIGRLAGGVAHDFNNLLTIVITNLEMILLTAKEESVRRLAETAKRVSLRGARLTHSLLAFGRRAALRPQSVDTRELLDRFTQLFPKAIGEKIEMVVSTEPAVRPVFADPAQLEVALLNLALNARDAMPAGGIVRLESRNVSVKDAGDSPSGTELKPGEYVALSVTDTGGGIPAEIREKVFEPFFTTKGVGKGAGLGLAQVKGFVRQTGGDVDIRTSEAGTIVTLYVPSPAGAESTSGITNVTGDARRDTAS